MNLYAVVERMARERAEAPFISCEGDEVSYAELHARVGRAAVALTQAGLAPGDRVATILRNRLAALEIMYACAWTGAIWAPVNWRLAPAEWRYILEDLEPGLVIVEDDLLDIVSGLIGEAPVAPLTTPADRSWDAELAAAGGPPPPVAGVRLDDAARVMYTSGTTAHPKGVVLSHGNILFKNAAYEREFALTDQDVVLMMGPMFHVGGLDAPGVGIANSGGRLVVLPAFDPPEVIRAIDEHQITVLWSAPTMTELLLAAIGPDPGDRTRSVRVLVTGSSQSAPDLLQRTLVAFPEAAVNDGYGMTESASGSIFVNVRERPDKIGTVGSIDRPMMYEQIRVIGDDGIEVEPGEPGEVQVSGGKVFRNYWRNPTATADAFTADGWYRTGDVGILDADRFLAIVDRKKDMIKSGGENIGSGEIERVIVSMDGVLAASAVAAPDPKWGEVPVVFVEVLPGAALTEAEIRASCTAELAKFKVPKHIYLVDSVPRTPSGKARKGELRQRAAELVRGREVNA